MDDGTVPHATAWVDARAEMDQVKERRRDPTHHPDRRTRSIKVKCPNNPRGRKGHGCTRMRDKRHGEARGTGPNAIAKRQSPTLRNEGDLKMQNLIHVGVEERNPPIVRT